VRDLSVNGPDFDVLRPLKQGLDKFHLPHVTFPEGLDQHLRLGNDGQYDASITGLGFLEQLVEKRVVRLCPVEEIDQRARIEAEPAGLR
jgi:hypothetical protein